MFRSGIRDAIKFMRKIDFNPAVILIPVILSLLSVLFDGLSKGILIPLIRGIMNMDFSSFIFLVILVFITAAVQYVLSYFALVIVSYQARRVVSNLRKAIFNRYLSFGKLFFDKTSFGQINSVLIEFTDIIATGGIYLQRLFLEAFRIVVYLIILFFISWKITIFVVLIFPILHFGLRHFILKIKSVSQNLASARRQLSRRAFNILSNITLVKAYTTEEAEKEKFAASSDRRADLEFNIDKKQFLIKPLQSVFILVLFLGLISVLALVFMKHGPGSFPQLLVYLYLLKGGIDSFGSINTMRAVTAEVSGPAENILKVFDDEDKYIIPSPKEKFTGLKKEIKFKNLSFSYAGEKEVLKDITFSITKGEMVALVGPSGSGKTTIINLLMRFYDCPPQTIMIDGNDIRRFSFRSLRNDMALVTQEALLFNDTLRNNIAYGLERISEEKILEALKKARLYDFVAGLPRGLDTLIGDKGVNLSGGEKQRLSIARALLKGDEILILDEATSSLDTKTEKLVQEAIKEAVKDKTSIIIAHRLSTIKSCDRVIVVEDGRIAEEGTMEELLKNKGRFYHYWQEQKFY